MYYDPQNRQLNLSFAKQEKRTVELFNSMGECVFRDVITERNAWLPVPELASGMYVLRVVGTRAESYKFMIVDR
jgi:hypothetical protein